MRKIITNSPDETKAFAAGLAKELKPGSVLALHGDLGSGKTCFVQGLAEALGVKEIVNSPTFAIINEYRGRVKLYHVDLYRVKSAAEAEALGMDDFLGLEGIAAIEWPEIFLSLLPKNAIRVYFEFMDADRRRITIHPSSPRSPVAPSATLCVALRAGCHREEWRSGLRRVPQRSSLRSQKLCYGGVGCPAACRGVLHQSGS